MKLTTIMDKIRAKKLIAALIIGMIFTTTSVFGYVTVSYILNKVVDQSVTVGETIQYTDGIIVELYDYDVYTLTFFELEETDTSKHYITYTYNYTVLVGGVDIEVSSLTDDIVVSNLVATDTQIAITFSLNQEKEFNKGDILNIQFYFEAVESSTININTATVEQLMSIGFTETEATAIYQSDLTFNNLPDVYINIDISDAITRFEPLVNDGTLVFE